MHTGPVEVGATIVTNVALAAARTAVKQQVQYNETIQKSAEREAVNANAAKAKELSAGTDKAAKNPGSQSGQGGGNSSGQIGGGKSSGQVGFTGIPPQSVNSSPSRGSQIDFHV